MRVSLIVTKLRSELEYQNCIHIAKYNALFYDAEKVYKVTTASYLIMFQVAK